MSRHKNKYCPTPQKPSPKNQSSPSSGGDTVIYKPMAYLKPQKLDDRNEKVNWEYLLVSLHSLFQLRIDSFGGCGSLESFFFLDFPWPKHKICF